MRIDPDRRLGIGNLLGRNWWTLALRGAIAILFGLLLFFFPGITLATAIFLFGLFALLGGILVVIAAIKDRQEYDRWWLLLSQGLIGIGIGLLTLFWPTAVTLIVLYVIAAWAILSGILEIVAAIQLRRAIDNEWLLGLAGVLSVIFGLILVFWPVAGILAILWVIGIYAIIFGVLLLLLALRLRSWHQQRPPEPPLL